MISCAFCGGSIENKTGPYKFDSTKRQVLAIVNNFGQIRSELQELK